jgi:uncharacterized membrane protein YeiH
MYILSEFNYMNFASTVAVFIIGVTLRLVAYHKKWKLPTLN